MTDIVTKETTTVVDGNNKKNAKNPSGSGEKAEKSQTIGYIIYFIFGVIEILIIFRLFFKITGANPVNNFVSFIYSLTQIFILPFTGIFPQASTQGAVATAVLEPSSLVAIVVLAALAWGITQIVVILSGRVH